MFGPMPNPKDKDWCFADALIWHMDQHGPGVSELAQKTEVSRDIINQLRARRNRSTDPKNATRLAAFYGKTYQQFMELAEVPVKERLLRRMVTLLSDTESDDLADQIEEMLAAREKKASRSAS